MKIANRETLLGSLPAYKDEWVLVHPQQSVKNIIAEVLDAHRHNAKLYDLIALYFDSDDTEEICKTLYSFCKKNFRYKEETEDEQTTATPQGLLTWGKDVGVDCKHYSSFCGGVLDALNRVCGRNIDWNYRFASYRPFQKTPHHVFVVVNDDGVERWIDPTPGANEQIPIWQLDKKVKSIGMPLYRNIGGLGQAETMGLVVNPDVDVDNINYDGLGHYANAFGPHLGLTAYADYENSDGTDFNALANEINQRIAQGPQPGHTVDAAFVKWIFDNNVRFWNFYYQGGVFPGMADTVDKILPASWPRPVVTSDNRLTFDRDVEVDDYRNAEIHVLNAALQDLINRFDGAPYPLKPRDVKLFSQEHHWGNPNDPNANLFHERRGTSDVTKALHTINKVVNVVKNGVLKIVGAVPRNAFLGLVGINAFGMANHLMDHINAGKWSHISKIWKDLGGNPGKLQSTIAHGSTKPRIDDETHTVDENTLSGTIGAVQLAAILAAAAPIIAALMKFLGAEPKLTTQNQSYIDRLNAANPGHTFSVGPDGELLEDGLPALHIGTPEHQIRNIVAGVVVASVSFYALNRRTTGKKKKLLLPAAAGIGTYYALHFVDQMNNNKPAYNQPGAIPTTQTQYSAPSLNWQSVLQTGINIFQQSQSGQSSAAADYALPVDYTAGGDVA